MLRAALSFFAITLLAFTADPAGAAEGEQCTLNRYADIDISVSDDSITFPVMIGDAEVLALLDLKSESNMMTRSLAREQNQTTRSLSTSVEVNTPDGAIRSYARGVPVTMGLARFALNMLLYPGESVTDSTEEAIDITLGIGVFENVDLELDFANNKLYLYSQEHCEGEVVYWANRYGRVPMREGEYGRFLVMELDGAKLETAIATDASATSLDEVVLDRVFDIELGDIEPEGEKFRFMSLTTEGIEVMSANIALIERENGCGLALSRGQDDAAGYTNCGNAYPLLLGLDVLRHMHIYFATRENMMYFTAADATHETEATASSP